MQIEMFFESACMDYTNKDAPERYARAQAILDRDPEIIQFDIYTSSIVGDIGTVEKILEQNPSLSRKKGGPRNWDPLLYLCYSRVNMLVERYKACPSFGFAPASNSSLANSKPYWCSG